jgi:hypothetical protein
MLPRLVMYAVLLAFAVGVGQGVIEMYETLTGTYTTTISNLKGERND